MTLLRVQPFKVSVIIPALNAQESLPVLLKALSVQTYPKENIEVIVVDNGSTDSTQRSTQSFQVNLLHESYKNSYAARNTGIAHATGDVLIFVDTDCVPEPTWIEEGIRAIESGADMVGGHIHIVVTHCNSPAQWCDALFFLRQKDFIQERGVACTANLFVRRSILENVGRFPTDAPSGSDMEFTANARAKGFSIAYAENAVVRHPARGFFALLKKAMRVGAGKGARLRSGRSLYSDAPEKRMSLAEHLWSILSVRLQPKALRALGDSTGTPVSLWLLPAIWLCAGMVLSAAALGMLMGFCAPQGKKM